MQPILNVSNIEKYYGNKGMVTKAVDNISFSVNKGEFDVIYEIGRAHV